MKEKIKKKLKIIVVEFLHHFPYSAMGVAAAFGILLWLEKIGWQQAPLLQFHVTHPIHLFLSAFVTTAMFWKYEQKIIKGILVGGLGVIPICTASDILFPFLGAQMMGATLPLHICLFEEPVMVLASTGVGIFAGFILVRLLDHVTELTHMLHVLVSSLASLLYLITFDNLLWQNAMAAVFSITLVAVWVPCCLSDIAFPLALTSENYPHEPHFH